MSKRKRAEEQPFEKTKSRKIKDEAGRISCVCGNDNDDGFMIQCEGCLSWLHVVCVGVTEEKIPEVFICERCPAKKCSTGTDLMHVKHLKLANLKDMCREKGLKVTGTKAELLTRLGLDCTIVKTSAKPWIAPSLLMKQEAVLA